MCRATSGDAFDSNFPLFVRRDPELQEEITTEIAGAADRESRELDQLGGGEEGNLPGIEDIVSVCCGLLVTLDGGSGRDGDTTIRLVYQMTQEYLKLVLARKKWSPSPGDVEAHIARVCVSYLSRDSFASGACDTDETLELRLRESPLYAYAAKNRGHHARRHYRTILAFPQQLPHVEAASQALLAVKRHAGDENYSQEVQRQVAGLHLVVYFGIEEPVRLLLHGVNTDVNHRDSDDMTPLAWAAVGGKENILAILLATGRADASVEDRHGRTPLGWAAGNGHIGPRGCCLRLTKSRSTGRMRMLDAIILGSWTRLWGYHLAVSVLASQPPDRFRLEGPRWPNTPELGRCQRS